MILRPDKSMKSPVSFRNASGHHSCNPVTTFISCLFSNFLWWWWCAVFGRSVDTAASSWHIVAVVQGW
eukprot:750989-Hanusia_phi.AAC.7